MTGYTVHTGSSKKYSDGWDQIFSGDKKKPKASASAKKKSPKKKPAKPAKTKKKK